MVLLVVLWYRWAGLDLTPFGVDTDVYARGGQAIVGREDLYAVEVHGLLFTYSPFAAVLFAPLAGFPAEVNRALFGVLSLAAYAWVLAVVARRLSLPRTSVVLLGLGGLALEPFVRGMLLGQVNLMLMAVVLTDVLVLRGGRRGYLVGLAAGVKLVPGIFVLYFVLRRDWRAVRHSAIGFVLSVVVGALVAPQATWQYWSGGFLGMRKFGESSVFAADNQSLSAFLMRLTHATDLPLALSVVGCVVGVVLGAAAAWSQLRRGQDVAAVLCLAIGGLLGSPVSWSHHWMWVVVALMVLASRRHWVSVWLAGALFSVAPFWLMPVGDFRELGLSPAEQVLGGCYVLAGILLLGRLHRAGAPVSRASGPDVVDGALPGGGGRHRTIIMGTAGLGMRPGGRNEASRPGGEPGRTLEPRSVGRSVRPGSSERPHRVPNR